jgi:hypothetical protein
VSAAIRRSGGRQADGITLTIRVAPKSGRDAVAGWSRDGNNAPLLKVRVAAAPEDGRANDAVVALLAQRFAVPKKSVTILGGASARIKRVRIGGDPDALRAHLKEIGGAE